MADDPPPDPGLPTNFGGLDPGELLARGMHSVKMSSPSGVGWTPPSVVEVEKLFPNYEVVAMLGHGGMGAVYQAKQTALDRLVAIKLLPLEISVDENFANRFRREARAMAKLNHPNIIAVFDFGQTSEGHLFFVMEYVDGASLHDCIHGSELAPVDALKFIEQVCDALEYAHGEGIVHRDIKPANVMIDRRGRAKVADFGLARLTGAANPEQWSTTVTGTVMGTPDYMAPEQKRGQQVDHRADIYALGVMLYEALCKETPQGAFELPSQRCGVDSRLDAIVTKALATQPERRFQSTAEMKTAIEAIRPALTTPNPISSAAPERAVVPESSTVLPHRRRKVSRPLLIGALALAFVGALWFRQIPDGLVRMKNRVARLGNRQGARDARPVYSHEGEWKPIAAVFGGVPLRAHELAAITLRITGRNYEVTVEGEKEPDKGTCTLDTSTTPRRMTLKSTSGPNRGKTLRAIYEMKDAGSLRVCYNLSGTDFPNEFRSLKGTQLYLAGYRRPKKEAAAVPIQEQLPFADHRYKLVRGVLSWEDAKGVARKMGGHLATITSKEENDWIIETFLRPDTRFWLGGRSDASGAWTWITGEPWGFTGWAKRTDGSTEPTGTAVDGRAEDCLEMTKYDQNIPPGGWNDRNGAGGGQAVSEGFLVEWDSAGDPAKPGGAQ